jgi:hypothetical protein
MIGAAALALVGLLAGSAAHKIGKTRMNIEPKPH